MSLLEQLAQELKSLERQKAPEGPNVSGPDSLFGVPGLERDVISSRVSPQGILEVLPVRGSTTTYPLFPYLTGWTAPSGDQPTEDCADGPVAGNAKTCLQTAQFGSVKYRTRELNITTLGEQINRGEFQDLRFVNDPLADRLAEVLPNVDRTQASFFGREVLVRFIDVGIAFQNYISRTIWTGTGTGNEWPGLEKLVVKDHFDAKTNDLCEALESDIRDFGDVDITTASGASQLVTTLVDIVRHARYNAQRMNFGNVTWTLAMKWHAFQEITDIWPCAYMTNRCELDGSNKTVFVEAEAQMEMRQQMRDGSYLLVDDMRIPVVTDDGLPETDLGELKFSSDIYLLPLTIQGGRPVLYIQNFDYSKATIPAIRDGRLEDIFWTDRGLYLWYRNHEQNGCVRWQGEVKLRVILETPQLAARLQNVAYTVDKHVRTHDPEYTAYFLDGGVEGGREVDTLYTNW